MSDKNIKMDRREFLKVSAGGAVVAAAAMSGCQSKENQTRGGVAQGEIPTDKMTYRTNPTTKDKVSILGYGCMRWPNKVDANGERPRDGEIDQDMVNQLIDFALAHGVNYFDTAPVYCKGKSEQATGIALSRHPRNSYFIATKLSNFSPEVWSREKSLEMYENSFKELQTDYIDYLLLHGIGMGGMDALHGRYLDNGVLDFLLEERKKGRIRNLGFSYHGDVEVFDYLLANQDKYHWDFVQIQHNYLDWHFAKKQNERNTNSEYLYDELSKRGIPVVVMEPLLGGRLASLPDYLADRLQQRRPEQSMASWAFRFAGSKPDILTVLSGMTYMEHLEDNLRTFCPLDPITSEEDTLLMDTAEKMVSLPLVPCTACQYCMPCPYGIDIPSNMRHYNKCVCEEHYPQSRMDKNYQEARRAFLIGYDRSVPKLRQASHCIGCHQCEVHCPQGIHIADKLHEIDAYVEKLKQGTLPDQAPENNPN